MNDWRALHIFYHAIDKREKLIMRIHDIVSPLISEGRMSQWFYINYWEGGPHVRLRMKDISEADLACVRAELEKYLAEEPSVSSVSKEQYYRNHKFDGTAQDADSLPWYGDNTVEEIPYEPEVERYGGSSCIGIAEEFFMASSETAVNIIRNVPASPGVRLSLASDLYLASFDKCGLLDRNFLEKVSVFWKVYSDEGIEKMTADPRTRDVFVNKLKNYDRNSGSQIVRNWHGMIGDYFAEVSERTGNRNLAAMVLISQMHMLNNRLSVPPAYEYMIIKMLAEALGGKDDEENRE